MKVMKRVFATILAVALVISGIYFVPTDAEEVAATTSTSQGSYEVVAVDDVTESNGVPVKDGYLFAGWFGSAECTQDTAVADKESASYAKFVKEDVLTVKLQISTKEVKDGDISAHRTIRFISSVESLDYNEVGFILNGDTEKQYATDTVYERIDSTLYEVDGSNTEKLDYAFSPKIIGTTSEYFFTAKLKISEEKLNTDYTVQAYWKTLDGTIVYGNSRCVNVSEDSGTRVLNLTLDGVLSGDTTTSFTTSRLVDATEDDITVKGATVKVLDTGSDYTNVRISWSGGITVNDLASATTISVGDASGIYRNYYTAYTGSDTEDTSWYEIDKNALEFTVATSADLQGMAYLVNNGKDVFNNNTITLVGDVKVNNVTLVKEGAPTSEALAGTDIITWTPIGCETAFFQGAFDGDFNTISGLYINATTRSQGLFGCAVSSSTIQNVQVSDSYMVTTSERLGGIIGWGEGNVENAYVDETVYLSANGTVGGIVGFFSGSETVSVSECWFAGTACSGSYYLGGIVGSLYNGNKTINNCLFTGTVQSTSTNTVTGGIAGGGAASKTIMKLKDCVSSGSVNSEKIYRWVGGAFGSLNFAQDASVDYELTMENVYTTNERDYTAGADNFPTTTDGATDGMGTYTTNKTNIGVKGVATIVTDDELTGTAGYANTDLDFYSTNNEDGIWVATNNGPELRKFSTASTKYTSFTVQRSNVDWYRAQYTNATSGTMALPSTGVTFELDSAGDMNGFAKVANGTSNATIVATTLEADNFSGDMVKMTDDIALNPGWIPSVDTTGTLTNGEDVLTWTAVTTFSGTFDGDNHELSGVYHIASANISGLFGTLASGSQVKNLALTDSYYTNGTSHSMLRLGAITGDLNQGTIQNVYTNAIMKVDGWSVGGFVGRMMTNSTTGTSDLEKCWYDGELYITGTEFGYTTNYFGGIVGMLGNNTSYVHDMKDCLNTGTILQVGACTNTPFIAGIAGGCQGAMTANLTNCVNAGVVKSDDYSYEAGLVSRNWNGTITFTDCYNVTEKCETVVGYSSVAITVNVNKNGSTETSTMKSGFAPCQVDEDDFNVQDYITAYLPKWSTY